MHAAWGIRSGENRLGWKNEGLRKKIGLKRVCRGLVLGDGLLVDTMWGGFCGM